MWHVMRDAMPGYEGSEVAWDFAYTLTTVLSGEALTDESLSPLSDALAGVFESSAECRVARTSLTESGTFRRSTPRTYRALRRLGVSDSSANICIEDLLRAGMMVSGAAMLSVPNRATRLVVPIPPSQPPSLLR